jgi:hypothetical protein
VTNARAVDLASDAPVARVLSQSLIRCEPLPEGESLLLFSGSIIDEDGVSPRTWGATGRRMLDEVCARLSAARRDDARIWIRAHSSHVLSDTPSAARFLREWHAKGFDVVLDPIAMLTPEMAAGEASVDFLRRIVEWGVDMAASDEPIRTGIAGIIVSDPFTHAQIHPKACAHLSESLSAILARVLRPETVRLLRITTS